MGKCLLINKAVAFGDCFQVLVEQKLFDTYSSENLYNQAIDHNFQRFYNFGYLFSTIESLQEAVLLRFLAL